MRNIIGKDEKYNSDAALAVPPACRWSIFGSEDAKSSSNILIFSIFIQSGALGLAKHGGAYSLAVNGSIKDPIAALGPYENQEL